MSEMTLRDIRRWFTRLVCAVRGHQSITVIDSVDWSGATIGIVGGFSTPGSITGKHRVCRRCHRQLH